MKFYNENNDEIRTGERVYFSAGDMVIIKHDLDPKPKMMVQSVDKTVPDGILLGVTCIWFSTDGKIQKHRFNTKDLKKLN